MTTKSVSERHVSALLARWKERHGPRVHHLRSSKIREVIEVQYADGAKGHLERDNFATTWDIVLSADDDKAPASKVTSEDISRTEALAAPNLRESLGSRQ